MHTILVAEDHDGIRTMLYDLLSLEPKWNVAAMPSGVALLKTSLSLRPDLIILDIGLPQLDGLDIYELLRQQEATRDVPILFITANPARLYGIQLRGPWELLVKPFNIAECIARVGALLGDTLLDPDARTEARIAKFPERSHQLLDSRLQGNPLAPIDFEKARKKNTASALPSVTRPRWRT